MFKYKKKYTAEEMREAVDRASDLAYKAGYNAALDLAGRARLSPSPTAMMREVDNILRREEVEHGEL